MLGAATVALFFLLLDTLHGEPLYTPNLLGSVLFSGKGVDEVTAIDMTVVFAYTGLHVMAFVAFGIVIAWMVSVFVSNPQFGIVLLLLFLMFEAVLFGFEVTLVPQLVGALGAWAVALANVLAAVLMFWFPLNRHPEALERLRGGWDE
jgi:HAMP domain-containing protein